MLNQVENFNEPSLLSLRDFDDGADLSHYDFDSDNLTLPVDTANKRKLAYRHRVVGELYEKVKKPLTFLTHSRFSRSWHQIWSCV